MINEACKQRTLYQLGVTPTRTPYQHDVIDSE